MLAIGGFPSPDPGSSDCPPVFSTPSAPEALRDGWRGRGVQVDRRSSAIRSRGSVNEAHQPKRKTRFAELIGLLGLSQAEVAQAVDVASVAFCGKRDGPTPSYCAGWILSTQHFQVSAAGTKNRRGRKRHPSLRLVA
jgi:hypothetical protein